VSVREYLEIEAGDPRLVASTSLVAVVETVQSPPQTTTSRA
jgi:hypothetical protein